MNEISIGVACWKEICAITFLSDHTYKSHPVYDEKIPRHAPKEGLEAYLETRIERRSDEVFL